MHNCNHNCQFVPHHVLQDIAILNGVELDAPHGILDFENPQPKRKINIQVSPAPLRFARLHKAGTPLVDFQAFSAGAGAQAAVDLSAADLTPDFPVHDLNGATQYGDVPEYVKAAQSPASLLKGDVKDWPNHAKNAQREAQRVYQFYKENYSRNSIDDKGMDIVSAVRLRTFVIDFDPRTKKSKVATDQLGNPIRVPENNAFWDGTLMAYGEGDGMVFTDFTASKDVVGHELTHGVTQFTCNLRYEAQSGALNEHISDVFGVCFRQWDEGMKDPKTANWLIGDGCISEDFKKMVKVRNFGQWEALRSMAAPGTAYNVTKDANSGKDQQPAHMSGYYKGSADNHGVHINSGIPNHAFYLFATKVGVPAWDIPAKIWYTTISEAQFGREVMNSTGSFERTAEFTEFAEATIGVAKRPEFGDHAKSLLEAWQQVGVLD
jgi:Zn-dependent metalloprotease